MLTHLRAPATDGVLCWLERRGARNTANVRIVGNTRYQLRYLGSSRGPLQSVADSLSIRLPSPSTSMQAAKLPIEVCERVIDSLAISVRNPSYLDYVKAAKSNRTLHACALVCRDWVYRSQYHLFRQVELRTPHQADAFLNIVTHDSHRARLVQFLRIRPHRPGFPPSSPVTPPPSPSDQMVDKVKKSSVPICYYNWIYKLLIRLPPLLDNLSTLALDSLPTLHPLFIRLVSCFKTVKALALQDLADRSFREIVQLINRLPQLTFLYATRLDWGSPARFFPSHRLRLEHLVWVFSREGPGGIERDVLDWLGSLQHPSGLRSLRLNTPNMFDTTKLHHILQRCMHSLRFLDLDSSDAGIFESVSLSGHSELEYLKIWILSSPFPNHIALFSSCISQFLPSSIVHLSIGYFENLDPKSFAASQSNWKDVDNALSDPKFNRLTYFVMEADFTDEGTPDRKTLQATLKHVFPKCYKRGILWVTKWISGSGWRAFHICEDDERDFNIDELASSYFRM